MSKQYLLMCGEEVKVVLDSVVKGVEYLEIQGMNLNGENRYNLLVTPVTPQLQPVVEEGKGGDVE